MKEVTKLIDFISTENFNSIDYLKDHTIEYIENIRSSMAAYFQCTDNCIIIEEYHFGLISQYLSFTFRFKFDEYSNLFSQMNDDQISEKLIHLTAVVNEKVSIVFKNKVHEKAVPLFDHIFEYLLND